MKKLKKLLSIILSSAFCGVMSCSALNSEQRRRAFLAFPKYAEVLLNKEASNHSNFWFNFKCEIADIAITSIKSTPLVKKITKDPEMYSFQCLINNIRNGKTLRDQSLEKKLIIAVL